MEREEILERIHENGLTEEQYNECLRYINENTHYTDIINNYHLNIPIETLRRANLSIFGGKFIYDYLKSNKEIVNTASITTTINKDGSQTSNRIIVMSESESKDVNYLLKAHGFDPDFWELQSAKNSQWQQNSKQNGLTTLYSSKITVKPRVDKDVTLEQIEKFFNNLNRTYKYKKNIVNNDYLKGDKLLLINIADLHYNLQCSLFTTNDEYNIDIAEQRFIGVLMDIKNRTNKYDFNKILFTIGGDMLNSDNLQGTTTKGTPQDNQLHYYDACERLYNLTIKAIDILKELAPVEVVYVPGNHDEVTSYKLAKYIQAWFRDDKFVDVDYQPLPRKYKVFGNTLLCFMHDGKVKDLPALISDEARQYWSQVKTAEVFLQHLHTEQILVDNHNIRIQRLPTISGNSKWTNDNGYNSKKQCKAFIFDKQDGLTDVLYTVI